MENPQGVGLAFAICGGSVRDCSPENVGKEDPHAPGSESVSAVDTGLSGAFGVSAVDKGVGGEPTVDS